MNDELWQAIGIALGPQRLGQEISNLKDSRLILLLQGKSLYTDEIKTCDKRLAELFGGEGAVVSTIIEPPDLRNKDMSLRNPKSPNGYPREVGHTAIPYNDVKNTNDRGGIIHIYANPQGLPGDVGLYVPAGFRRIFEVRDGSKVEKLLPKADNQKYFYSDTLKIYIVFSHVKTDGVSGIGERKANGSVKIGNIGGPGGYSGNGYFHTHIVFFSEYFGHPYTGTRVDPRNYFCK